MEYVNEKRTLNYSRKFCFDCSPYGEHNTKKEIDCNTVSNKSYIYTLSSDKFKKLIELSNSRADFFRKVKRRSSSASHIILNRRIKSENIDISHFGKNKTSGKKLSFGEILIENSPYKNTNNLKIRLLKEKIIKNKHERRTLESRPALQRPAAAATRYGA